MWPIPRARSAEWHEKYTLPSLWDFYEPSRENHGSYYYDWTSWDEIAWKNFYNVWFQLLDDYKDMGGRVTVSSDAGYTYNLFGFSTIEEMELLQEAGFHPLEVIRGATMHGAQALFEPNNPKTLCDNLYRFTTSNVAAIEPSAVRISIRSPVLR